MSSRLKRSSAAVTAMRSKRRGPATILFKLVECERLSSDYSNQGSSRPKRTQTYARTMMSPRRTVSPRMAFVVHSPSVSNGMRVDESNIPAEEFWRGYNYLRRHRRYMDYAGYRRRGLPIGSGVTEAACKTVFTQRLKRSGMRWNGASGQVIVDLRVIHLSGIWDDAFARDLGSRLMPQPLVPSPHAYEGPQPKPNSILRFAA